MKYEMEIQQQLFLDLFLPIRERLWRFIRATTRTDRDTVDDIMSETILIAYEGLPKLRDQSAFRSYCFTIARRVAQSLKRKASNRSDRRLDAGDALSDAPSPELQHDLTVLFSFLEQLPEKTRETVLLFEISDLSLEEIRSIQGGTLSGVKSRLLRGRNALVSMMNDSPGTSTLIVTSDDQSETTSNITQKELSL